MILSLLAVICAAEFNLPNSDNVFVFEGPGLVMFEGITHVDQGLHVDYRLGVGQDAGEPGETGQDSHTDFQTLAGIIPLGDRLSSSFFRMTELPEDALNQLRALSPGQSVVFEAQLRAQFDSRPYQSLTEVSVLFEGCDSVETPAGQFDVQRYLVDYPTIANIGGQLVQSSARRVVDYAPALGWPVRHDYGEAGEALLIRID